MMLNRAARQRTGQRSRWLRMLVPVIACLTSSGIAAAGEVDVSTQPRLTLNGYGTIGYVSAHTSDENRLFRRDLAQSTSTPHGYGFIPDSNLGLQLNLQVNERASLISQVVVRRRAPSSPAEESLEWAFGSYRIQPDLKVRLGRLNPDIFLLADHRNVGFAYPWARPNTEFYGWMPLSAVDGIDITKAWRQGEVRWEANGMVGFSNRLTAQSKGFADTKFKGKDGISATLAREEGGLTLKLSYARTNGKFELDPQINQVLAGLNQLATNPGVNALAPAVAQEAAALNAAVPVNNFKAQYVAGGLRWETGPWMVQSEIAHVSGDFKPTAGTFAYFSTGYRYGNFTFTGMLGRARSSWSSFADPQWLATLQSIGFTLPQAAAAQGAGTVVAAAANSSRMDQHSVSAGMRWDITPQTALKLQWDRVFIGANGRGLWASKTQPSLGQVNTPSGRADVYSASLSFVF